MAVYSIKAVQKIPLSLEEAWKFFSKPDNLQIITPAIMGFQIRSRYHGNTMYPGQILEYTVRPLFNIPLYWMTEITHVEQNRYFVDEQRFGPYTIWHHQHHFRALETGVEMTDIVHYKIPFWFLGDLANAWYIRNELRTIFSYRYEKVEGLFGKWPGTQDRNIAIS